MIDSLSSLASDEVKAGITIVFDAIRLPLEETETVSQKGGMTVMFAVDHEDADSLIEELILKNSSPKQLTVVSSDHRLHKAALRRKATPIDSDVWFDRLEQLGNQYFDTPDTTDGKPEKPDLEVLKQVDWANEFRLTEKPISTASESDCNDRGTTFNPFPKGYGDDLGEKLADDEPEP